MTKTDARHLHRMLERISLQVRGISLVQGADDLLSLRDMLEGLTPSAKPDG
jgi:hypothetical protein